ncbi:hypothetical protein A3A36_00975 [Candidatus Kaiserbacteria bacterium RIFCSPLOWO2_01_FULL_52_12b]|uniref:Uncharacterized protein n=1 Tax=Candidatus Kaiserbacteria bacterium RIFCSPLOWO2_01_FULL_52_12b TaxID=1798509 RepID=A0A1F6EWM5_9BACT|nr:MAG: hypothetical protein A3A36_00975 [Candidatus Kaiserbacteria bacterium RIFCSPLOWO2_01_FULL_52_12b]
MTADKIVKSLALALMVYVVAGLVISLWMSLCYGAYPLTRTFFEILDPGIVLSGLVMVPIIKFGELGIVIVFGIMAVLCVAWFLIHNSFHHLLRDTIVETFVRFLIVFVLFSFFFTYIEVNLNANVTSRVSVANPSYMPICFDRSQS